MTDTPGDQWLGITYVERRSFLRRLVGRPMLLACLAVALGVVFGFGVLAMREFGDREALEPAAAEDMATPMPVEITAPPPAPAPAATPLEVLPPETPSPVVARPIIRSPAPAAAPVQRADPGFDCRRRDTQSERLVCGNAELSALDRRMNRAFDAAVAAGAPLRSLRQDQDDWLRIREDAAQHEPDGVADMYRQRIMELEEIAANF